MNRLGRPLEPTRCLVAASRPRLSTAILGRCWENSPRSWERREFLLSFRPVSTMAQMPRPMCRHWVLSCTGGGSGRLRLAGRDRWKVQGLSWQVQLSHKEGVTLRLSKVCLHARFAF